MRRNAKFAPTECRCGGTFGPESHRVVAEIPVWLHATGEWARKFIPANVRTCSRCEHVEIFDASSGQLIVRTCEVEG